MLTTTVEQILTGTTRNTWHAVKSEVSIYQDTVRSKTGVQQQTAKNQQLMKIV